MVAEKNKRAMIQPEHIIAALEELGYSGYLDEVGQGASRRPCRAGALPVPGCVAWLGEG
jgi:hypothetical protein